MCFTTLVTQKVFFSASECNSRQSRHVSHEQTHRHLSVVFSVHVFDTKKLQRTSDLPLSMNVQCQLSCLCLLFITPLSLAFLNLFTFLSTHSLPHSRLSFPASRLPLCAVVMAESESRNVPVKLHLYDIVYTSQCTPHHPLQRVKCTV